MATVEKVAINAVMAGCRPEYMGTIIAAVEGLTGLRDYLANQRQADFLRQFSRKLLGYALGRSVQLSDAPLIDTLAKAEGSHVGSIIEQIVRSPQFREIRGSMP